MANGNSLNGHVAIPRYVMWLVGLLISTLVTVAVVDRRAIGQEMANMREDIAAIRETRFREADGLRLEQRLRAYIDQKIKEANGGNEP